MFPLSQLLSRLIAAGTLTVIDAEGGRHTFGNGVGPSATMQLHDATLYKKIFFSPELAAGEAYMDGTLTFPGSSLREFLSLVSHNQNRPGPVQSPFHRHARQRLAAPQALPAIKSDWQGATEHRPPL